MSDSAKPPQPDDTGYDLASWLAESGRRKVPLSIAALTAEEIRPPPPRRIHFVQPRLLVLFTLMAGVFSGYRYLDVSLQIEALPSLLFFVAR